MCQTTKRVAEFRANMAAEVLVAARDCGDAMVIGACIRVRNGWLLGHRVAIADLDLIQTFSAGEG
jgi:hypothetical protein